MHRWLDWPWRRGDLYLIQELVATIQARNNEKLIPRLWLPLV
ncbi:MAG: hypothetical protein NZ699_12340 [Roseiflexus sp.]|nr:hypothetical protein [Roseiflexus sp.]MDW8146754.1 hypothetical protein [Roseiflexaceae bacterium]